MSEVRRHPGAPGRLIAARLDLDLVSLRLVAGGILAAGAALAHLPAADGIPCPLRTLTGVPCPFCGCTTAVRDLMGGRPGSALAASFLGVAVALAAVVTLVMAAACPRCRHLRLPALPFVALVGASWVFELARFHLI